jgi:hypothetical protein
MERDVDRDEREAGVRSAVPERLPEPREAREKPLASREHTLLREHGYAYRLSPAELETMHDIGRFRTVALEDLARHRYHGEPACMQQDLRSLRAQGLVQWRTVWTGPRSRKLGLAVLTALGKAVLERHGPMQAGQSVYAGFVKPAEVRHDAAIYRMYHTEKQAIERAGGRVRRVILDYELKRKVYSPLAKVKALPPAEYAKRQIEVARQNGLKVIHGKIPLPDLRVEYETAGGELTRVDLELATGHYHGPALQAKAEAGFKFYAADGSGSRLSRVLEERDIVVAILSL